MKRMSNAFKYKCCVKNIKIHVIVNVTVLVCRSEMNYKAGNKTDQVYLILLIIIIIV